MQEYYQWFVDKTTRKYSICLHGALSSLKKRKRFLPVWVVCAYMVHFRVSKNASVFASMGSMCLHGALSSLKKRKLFLPVWVVCAYMVRFRATKTTSGF